MREMDDRLSAAEVRERQPARPVRPPEPEEAIPRLWIATADPSGGTVTVRPVDSSGTATGTEITVGVI